MKTERIAFGALLAVLALLPSCSERATHSESGASAADVGARWQYQVFQYRQTPPPAVATYLTFEDISRTGKIPERLADGRRVYAGDQRMDSLGDVLNALAAHDWELAWTDGREFIVRRRVDANREDINFKIHEEPMSASNSGGER